MKWKNENVSFCATDAKSFFFFLFTFFPNLNLMLGVRAHFSEPEDAWTEYVPYPFITSAADLSNHVAPAVSPQPVVGLPASTYVHCIRLDVHV